MKILHTAILAVFVLFLVPMTVSADSWPSWIGSLDGHRESMPSPVMKNVVNPASIPERFRPVHYMDAQPEQEERTMSSSENLWWPDWIGRPE